MPNKSVCTDNGDTTDSNIEPQRQTEIPDNCYSRKSHKSVKIADSSQRGLSEPRRSCVKPHQPKDSLMNAN